MRIAVVEPVARGGLIHAAFMLCRGLAREGGDGVEVTLITGRGYELAGMPHDFRVEPILRLWDPKPSGSRSGAGDAPAPERRVRRLARRLGRAAVWYREWVRLALRLRRLRPDVVQLGDIRFPGDLAVLWLFRALGLRLADVCHNVEPFSGGRFSRGGLRGRLVRWIYRRIYRCFDVVFVHYRVNREAFLRLYGLPRRRVRAIPLGHFGLFGEMRDAVEAREIRRRLGLPGDAPVVLLFGTLSPYKGADVLLDAFGRLWEAHPDARLVLAGFPLDGFDPGAYLGRARALGLPEGAVTLVPEYVRSEEVAAWMEMAEVAVFPYREIYQSGVLQVALTFGVPVVASRVGAVPEVVRDGETGLLVPPGDPERLAAALGRLLDAPKMACRMGERAAADQRRRGSWRRVSRRMLAAYAALVVGRTGEAAPERPAEGGVP